MSDHGEIKATAGDRTTEWAETIVRVRTEVSYTGALLVVIKQMRDQSSRYLVLSLEDARELSQALWNAADTAESVNEPDEPRISDRVPHHLWGRDPALVEAVVRQLDRCAQDGFGLHAMEALAARILDLVAMECDPNGVQLTADDSLVSWWPYIDAASGALLEVALCSPDDSLQQLCAEVRDWVGHVKRRGRIPTTWAWPDRAIRSRIVEI